MKLIRAALAALALLCAAPAFAATLLPPGEQQFSDADGVPYAGGKVYFYVPGTTTPKDTFTNTAQTVLNANPVTLDAAGRAIIYGDGVYRQILKDSLGNLVWDQPTASTLANSGVILWGGTSTGSANTQSITVTGFNATNGQVVGFVAGFTNTGPMTLDAGTGGIAVRTDTISGPVALTGGEVTASNVVVAIYVGGFFHLVGAPVPASFNYGNIFGLTLSNDVTDATNDLDIAIGGAADNTTNTNMRLSGAYVKQSDVVWAVGSSQGMLDTGVVGNNWYYVFLIQRPDTGVVDVLCSLSATAPTMPANYTLKRRIGAFQRTGGAIRTFVQVGNRFLWLSSVDNVSTVNPGVAAVSVTVTVPVAVGIDADIFAQLTDGTPATITDMLVTSPLQTDVNPGTITAKSLIINSAGAGVPQATAGEFRITTSTGAIRYRLSDSTASHIVGISTNGWWDNRGSLSGSP